MHQKQQACEECKNEYAAELQKTNEAQRLHYNTNMPTTIQVGSLFNFSLDQPFICMYSAFTPPVQNLQDMEKNRIARIQDFVRQGAEIERTVMPIVNTCIDGMVAAANSMNPDEVTSSACP